MKIYCLFSIENNYDQPSHNLMGWWPKQPTVKQLQKVIGTSTDVTSLLSGSELRVYDTDFRLEQVKEGKVEQRSEW